MQTNRKQWIAIFAVYLTLGPLLGAVSFVPANAVTVLIFGDATEARLFFVGGILLLPIFFLVGLPVSFACGIAAALQTRLQGRPGFLFPLMISLIGALVVQARAGAESPALMPLLASHVLAAAVCTVAARQLTKA